ncbi:MAG: agmatine deiminase family protein [Pseudomonadota bacterium]
MAKMLMDRRGFFASALASGAMAGAMAQTDDSRIFVAPHEGELHRRTWMCWPSTHAIYESSLAYFEDVQETLGRLASAIAAFEPVSMLADKSHHARARRLCGPDVELVDIATDDMWSRDSGPVFVRNGQGEKAVVDFNFNGWGGKQTHDQDHAVAKAVADRLGLTVFNSGLVGEGGGIEYDGDGTLILTESCWVNDNRNPGLTRDEIERDLKELLGVQTVIWLPGVRDRDITDGHIDGSLRVVRPGLLMMARNPGDTSSVWAQARAEAKAILNATRDAHGRTFDIVEIDSATKPRSDDPELFTSYANYYVGNGAVFTPEFGDDTADRKAFEALGQLYPDRQVISLNVDRIYETGGGIHCVTQQEPV